MQILPTPTVILTPQTSTTAPSTSESPLPTPTGMYDVIYFYSNVAIKLSHGPVAMVEKLILNYEHLFCIKVCHLYMNHFHYDNIFILYVICSAYGSTNKRQQLLQYQFWHSDH